MPHLIVHIADTKVQPLQEAPEPVPFNEAAEAGIGLAERGQDKRQLAQRDPFPHLCDGIIVPEKYKQYVRRQSGQYSEGLPM